VQVVGSFYKNKYKYKEQVSLCFVKQPLTDPHREANKFVSHPHIILVRSILVTLGIACMKLPK